MGCIHEFYRIEDGMIQCANPYCKKAIRLEDVLMLSELQWSNANDLRAYVFKLEDAFRRVVGLAKTRVSSTNVGRMCYPKIPLWTLEDLEKVLEEKPRGE